MKNIMGFCIAYFAVLLVQPAFALTTTGGVSDERGGQVVATFNGRNISFPSLKTEITGELSGDLASITVRQTFVNPTNVPINARYLFPLNKEAAVHAMQMRIGDELISAKIAKRSKARKTFQKAKQQGKAAALLEQHRPNMFTQEIANLMPGAPVVITLKYSQTVPRIDNTYELRVPLVVGPRYIPRSDGTVPQTVQLNDQRELHPDADEDQDAESEGWQFGPAPDYPPVAGLELPTTVLKERVSIRLSLSSAIPVREVQSATHTLDTRGDETQKTITLAGGKTIDNRDFVLRYTLAGEQAQAGLLTHKNGSQGTFSLMIEPPKVPQLAEVTSREMVFVLDTSGSMSGLPMASSRTFMRHALETLRAGDYFRIIRFSNNASEFSPAPLPATPNNVAAGTSYVNAITADGGTEILSGLRRAYARAPEPNMLRIVVFLSDGYVGNEAEILRLVSASVGRGRLYSFGVGSAVNRYLIEEMARQGRGISRIIDPTANGQEEAVKFAARLDLPLLTDIEINWGTLAPEDVTPALLPDLFAGDSLRIQGQFTAMGRHKVSITGNVNGRSVRLPLALDLTDEAASGNGTIPLIWARSRIADHMREKMVPPRMRTSGLSDLQIEQQVTTLGLDHSLVSQWTSFVAVSEKIVNANPDSAVSADVPVPLVKGVSHKAYPKGASKLRKAQSGGSGQAKLTQLALNQPVATPFSGLVFSGESTPEPEHVFALIVLLLSVGGTLVHQARRQFS